MNCKPFLISVHLRKCGGTTLSTSLQSHFGTRLILDYGDEVGSSWPSSLKKRAESAHEVRLNHENISTTFDAVHGHFDPEKYSCLKRDRQLISFVREPVERVLSNYFYLKRTVAREHPDHYVVGKLGFTLEEYVKYPDAQNVQTRGLGRIPLDTYAFLGITEMLNDSILKLNTRLELNLSVGDGENVNPAADREYEIPASMRDLIVRCNSRDVELYESVRSTFGQ